MKRKTLTGASVHVHRARRRVYGLGLPESSAWITHQMFVLTER